MKGGSIDPPDHAEAVRGMVGIDASMKGGSIDPPDDTITFLHAGGTTASMKGGSIDPPDSDRAHARSSARSLQ